jgi:hypothetical protein
MSALSEMSADGGDRLKVNHLKWTFLFGVMVIAPPASAITLPSFDVKEMTGLFLRTDPVMRRRPAER